MADYASGQKRRPYSDLTFTHRLVPLAFETMGAFSCDSVLFLKDVTRRIQLIKNDSSVYLSLCQRISAIVQRYDSVCVLGSCKLGA